ncbi:hypothetical protein EXIGLDRAFT_846655 [Exidia glandulosa HHB12029]|uniref:Uncharacterized protein n=1 Tax=Exidia glandulosa HHB12029 TaxID=1314781 RepID=A0A166NLU0_EXIGL|nr:hypothetical protein EXIGLDRAFT_846655 [Exidia glandulosa HHB12029]
MSMLRLVTFVLASVICVQAHVAAWTKGMYCRNGLSDKNEPNSGWAAVPVWNLRRDEWFMHGECRKYPPPDGEFLEIPANGHFFAELSSNRAFTHLSYNGALVTGWGDGKHHDDDYSVEKPGGFPLSGSGCIGSPNLHAKRESDAAGTVFAIAYKSDIEDIEMDELAVFTVAPNTPFKLNARYDVPNLPECPAGGCICAWGWVPNHCGQANVYMHPYRCKVTNARPDARPPARARPPVWCEGNPEGCMRGAKQMVIAHQAEGNNVVLSGKQADGSWKSPGYNAKMGFAPGAQHDIFDDPYADGEPVPTCADEIAVGDAPQAPFGIYSDALCH